MALLTGQRHRGARRAVPSLVRPWLVVSALWIAGVLFFESLDGKMGHELVEVFSTALLPPILPPLALEVVVRILAESFRP
jgi:hypothetical protein